MDGQVHDSISPAASGKRSGRWVAGLMLIAVGLFSLAGQFVRSEALGLMVLPGLGLFFVVWGLVSRNAGLLIPGGILSGLGVGVYLIEQPLWYLNGSAEGGVIVLSLAAGFVGVTLLTALATNRAHWWALIPASILGLVGAALLAGDEGLRVLETVGRLWPVVLIAIGGALILRPRD